MEQKSCRIQVCLSERRKGVMVDAAHRLGLTVSELVIRSVGEYLDAEQRGDTVTAVTFGGWILVYHDLAGIEAALRECAQQISATRHVVTMLADRGDLSDWRADDMASVLKSCYDEVREVRSQLSGCIEQVEGMRDSWVPTDISGVPVGSPLAEA